MISPKRKPRSLLGFHGCSVVGMSHSSNRRSHSPSRGNSSPTLPQQESLISEPKTATEDLFSTTNSQLSTESSLESKGHLHSTVVEDQDCFPVEFPFRMQPAMQIQMASLRMPGGDKMKKSIIGRYRLRRILGGGKYGKVWKVTRVSDGTRFAMKIIPLKTIMNLSSKPSESKQEISLLEAVRNHPSIARCQETFMFRQDRHSLYCIVNEYTNFRSLDVCIHLAFAKEWPLIQRCTIIRDVASGLACLHEHDIIHSDLKPGNIMLCTGVGTWLVAKVIDFGASMPSTRKIGKFRGTPRYSSPEKEDYKAYGPPDDCWALGIIIFEVMHSRYAPEGANKSTRVIRRTIMSLEKYSKEIASVCNQLLIRNPKDRMTAADAVKDLEKARIPVRRKFKGHLGHQLWSLTASTRT
ncbi:hypothetical protein AAMO2058_001179700 [Amorphochlora amoebiformis]